ncbi:MAG TPA: hypothetical protein QF873_02375 [Patescibacteria group bacterium]|nr:hypothetical protein [Patescibacteria group bacterium]
MANQFRVGGSNSFNRMGPSSGPTRMKKKAGFFQSIIGVLIGIVLVLGSPFAMWMAGSQDTAKDFAKAEQVDSSSLQSGFIAVRGAPTYATADGGDLCYRDGCISQVESVQNLETNVVLECRQRVQESATVRVLRQNGEECDGDTGECVPCWDVEKDTWEELSSSTLEYDVKIGAYVVGVTDNAILIDTVEDIVEDDYDYNGKTIARTVYTSFLKPAQLLAAGQSDGTTISTSAKRVFVLSSLDFDGTLLELQAQDRANKFALWGVTFFMLFIGFAMMFGPLEWMGRMAGKIPGVGSFLREGSKGMIAGVSFVLALVLWIIEFVFIGILQNIWLAGGAVIIIGALIAWRMKSGDKK